MASSAKELEGNAREGSPASCAPAGAGASPAANLGTRHPEHRDLRRRRADSRWPWPRACMPSPTSGSSMPSATLISREAGRVVGRCGGRRLCGQAKTRRDRSGRPLRAFKLGNGLCIDQRPDRCAAVSRRSLPELRERPARDLQGHGRQDHYRPPGASRSTDRRPLRQGYATDRSGNSRLPRHCLMGCSPDGPLVDARAFA